MTELKTKPTNKKVKEFLNQVENPRRRDDSFKILKLMQEVTNEEPIMWGDSIVGFGSYHYNYASGREVDWLAIGFSPRNQALTVYIMDGFEKYTELLGKLGKYKTGKSCLYINKLEDVNLSVLKELVIESVKYVRKNYR
ncbi:MAG: DUF1801 domain-containing protein [Candidatus Lokiarchaeota archaeon]|nr:DUF1801 domain-containing protein [Candidatus Lokiarchaeota archaeon]